MNPNPTIKIVIADDHDFARAGFKHILQQYYSPEIEFVAEAADGRELVQQVTQYHPDLVITDIKMPVMDGIDACKLIRQQYPKMGIIAFSMFSDIKYIMGMVQAGANGYLVKTSPKEEIIEAIRSINARQQYYCSSVSGKMYGEVINSKERHKKKKHVEFSPQEKIVMQLICKEYSTKEIANYMNLATRTIDHYRENILEKIGGKNVVGIALYAIVHEVVRLSDILQFEEKW